MSIVRLLHIIPHLSRGGASRSLIDIAQHLISTAMCHEVVSLLPPDGQITSRAEAVGLRVVHKSSAEVHELIEIADLVQIHFWNTPELYSLLGSDLPPMRLVIWFKIAGHQAPQMISKEVVAFAERALVSSAFSLQLPACQSPPTQTSISLAFSSPNFHRLQDCQPHPHPDFTIGYLGTVDFVKMHPDFVALCAQIKIPSAQFLVGGAGSAYPVLQQQIQQANLELQFKLLGYVEDVKAFFSRLDVFGYPLCPDNYATAELVLQESMYAGVPPVILAYGGAQATVKHDQTGLVVSTPEEYCRAIEYLYHHPQERLRLARGAQDYAQKNFGAYRTAEQFRQLYAELLQQPKRSRSLSGWRDDMAGCERFIFSLGKEASSFALSYTSTDPEILWKADKQIAAATPVLCSPGAGGLFHYRKAYPDDAYLRFWSGLVLQQQQRNVYSIGEFQQAIQKGFPHWRVYWYLAQAAARTQATALMKSALEMLKQATPELAHSSGYFGTFFEEQC